MRISAGLVSVILVMMLAGCGGGPPATASPSPGESTEPTLPLETPVPAEITPEPVDEVTPEPEETPEVIDEPEVTVYVVKKGDTLYAIAKDNGITLKALMDANPEVTDPKKLRVGQKLKIPAPAP
jgi:LysM repeat protein